MSLLVPIDHGPIFLIPTLGDTTMTSLPPNPPDLTKGYWLLAVGLMAAPAILYAFAALVRALR